MPLLPAGLDIAANLGEVNRRTGGDPLTDMAAFAVEFFVENPINSSAGEALAHARDFRPDLVVAEMSDYLGQFVAAALDVPWAAHGATLPLIEPLAVQFGQRALVKFGEHGLVPSAPFAYVDPWPDSLLRFTDHYPAPRMPIRPEPHAGEGPSWTRPAFREREDRPTVLLSLGTVVEDPQVLTRTVVAASELDVNLLLAPHTAKDLDMDQVDRRRVQLAGFVPMRDLLQATDLVVSAAGAGTVLAALSAGLPMVLLPLGLDKPVNAERAASVGAAEVVADPAEIGGAIQKVLEDDAYRTAAQTMAKEISAMPSPRQVLETLTATV
ncbi:hypothetical protein Acsp02_82240 [Actinoplanes sp. NBRC 103695]|nr:hypothetical protein Acsp02_82240 [Actinoplanes sp. NBRC 103695]